MTAAVIAATALRSISRAYRGAFNNTSAALLAAHAMRHALERARLPPAEVEDVAMGAAQQQGTQAFNVARQTAMRAGFPRVGGGPSVECQCAAFRGGA